MHTVTSKSKPVWVFPREHGAWAMLIMPFLLGIAISGVTLWQIIAGAGLFFGYLAMNAFLMMVRQPKKVHEILQSFLVYSGGAAILLLAPFLHKPQAFLPILIMIPLLGISVVFIIKKRERHFANDLTGIIVLTMLLPIAAGLGQHFNQESMFLAMALNIVYFTGSVFYVKSLIREKANPAFRMLGILYHLAVLVAAVFIHSPAMLALLYVPGAIKMLSVLKLNQLTPKNVGIAEIVNAVWFVTIAFMIF